MDILTVLILPIHEHGISFYLFMSSVSFTNVLQFSVYKSYSFFNLFLNGLLFLVDLSIGLFLQSLFQELIISATVYCVLGFCPTTLLKWFMLILLLESSGFPKQNHIVY
jgi:hypothetical protein